MPTAGETITVAIVEIAERARTAATPGACQDYASAVRQLAEAYAWLAVPGQPHGGSTSIAK